MKTSDWNKLYEMHHLIRENGITSFNSDFLETYSQLLAKSLEGKGNEITNYVSVDTPCTRSLDPVV